MVFISNHLKNKYSSEKKVAPTVIIFVLSLIIFPTDLKYTWCKKENSVLLQSIIPVRLDMT